MRIYKGLYRFDDGLSYLQASLPFVGKSENRERAGIEGGNGLSGDKGREGVKRGTTLFSDMGPGLHVHCAQTKEGRQGTRKWSAKVRSTSPTNPNLVFLDEFFDLVRDALGKVMYAEHMIFTLKPRTSEMAVVK